MNKLVKASLGTLAQSGDFDRLLSDVADIQADWIGYFAQNMLLNEADLTAEELDIYALAIVRKSERETGDQYMIKGNLQWARERVRARV